MSDESNGILLALPDLPGLMIQPNSKAHKCTFCPRELWVSPGGMPVLERGAIPVCPVCFRALANPADREAPPQFSPEIREEVERISGGVSPEEIMGDAEPDAVLSLMADRIIQIEGEMEREKRG